MARGGHKLSDCQRISALTPEPVDGPEVKTELGPLCKALASSRDLNLMKVRSL